MGVTNIYNTRLILHGIENNPNSIAKESINSQSTSLSDNPLAKPISSFVPTGTILGSSEAPVTIIEFGDFQCPFCKDFFSETFPQLKSQYIDTGKAKFYFQNFAFLGWESKIAAEASLCARDQGKFWEYHNYLYEHQKGENQGAFSEDNLKKISKTLSLNQKDFTECLDNHRYQESLVQETKTAKSFGVNATPTIFVNDEKIRGAKQYSEYQILIEKYLKK